MSSSAERVDVLHEIIWACATNDMLRRRPVGQVVGKVFPESRKVLADLKSDDIQNVRVEYCLDEAYEQKQRIKELLLAFDKKMNQW